MVCPDLCGEGRAVCLQLTCDSGRKLNEKLYTERKCVDVYGCALTCWRGSDARVEVRVQMSLFGSGHFYVYVSECVHNVLCGCAVPMRPRRGVRSPGIEATGSCEPPDVGSGS